MITYVSLDINLQNRLNMCINVLTVFFILCFQLSNVNSMDYTMKNYYFPNSSDEETLPITKPLKVRSLKRANDIDTFFEKSKKKQNTGLTSSVAQSTSSSTNYISVGVDEISKATHLVKIDVFDLKKIREVPSEQHWKFADIRVKYYTQTEDDDHYLNARELIFNITKDIAEKPNCKKYSIDVKNK